MSKWCRSIATADGYKATAAGDAFSAGFSHDADPQGLYQVSYAACCAMGHVGSVAHQFCCYVVTSYLVSVAE